MPSKLNSSVTENQQNQNLNFVEEIFKPEFECEKIILQKIKKLIVDKTAWITSERKMEWLNSSHSRLLFFIKAE